MSNIIYCPKCTLTTLVQVQKHGVTVDECPACKGCWYDPGELQRFIKDSQKLTDTLDKGLLTPRAGDRKCPRCKITMQNGGLSSEFLRIDRCNQCRGIWLDQSELHVLADLLGFGKAS